jgi:hypothetical protein
MPGRYRIEMITDPGFRPASIASDGEHLWRIHPDRVAVRPAGRLPGGIGSIIDPAWLLDSYRLSAQDTVTVSGRPGLRILAVPEHGPSPMLRQGLLPGASAVTDEIEVTVDTELAITLRQVWSCQGYPVLRSELSSVTTDIDPDAFLMQPPPGARICRPSRPAVLAVSSRSTTRWGVPGVAGPRSCTWAGSRAASCWRCC